MATRAELHTLESAARAAMVAEHDAIAGDRHRAQPDLRYAVLGLAALLVILALLALHAS